MFFIDVIVCFLVLTVEKLKEKKHVFESIPVWFQVTILAFIGAGLISGIRGAVSIYENKVMLENRGWWCEIKQTGRGVGDRLSCFSIEYNFIGNNVNLSGIAWEGGNKKATWEMIDLLKGTNNDSVVTYSYKGQSTSSGKVEDTLYGVTQLNFDQMSGWYLSRTYGKVVFDLVKLQALKTTPRNIDPKNIEAAISLANNIGKP